MASDLSRIKDEDLLRKLWQETEDFGRKKEIRAHMYKLREARLREFYVNEMDSKSQQFDAKAPITSRHGAMADHSFEGLKSNEIRGTDLSDIKFGDAGGWNVITSSEYSDDGKARTDKTMATTEGVQALKGGQKTFAGKNEELKTERFDGDAKNFTYTSGEQSNMELNENIVTGDDSSRRVEKKSSSVSQHSSTVTRSSTNSEPGANSGNVKLSTDSAAVQEAVRLVQQPGTILSREVERTSDNTNMITERKELHDGTIVTTRRYEPINSSHVDIQSKNTGSNQHNTSTSSSTTTKSETFKTARDEEAFRLSQQPGKVISRDVAMTDATTRMITEKKELNDGTIVTTKRYEKVGSEIPVDQPKFSTKTETNQQFKTARDEEAFRLAQQPGKVISRDVTMANPTTRMIVEKKELTDGTVVTTKRYESVDSSSTSDNKSVKSSSVTREQQSDDFAKSLRSDSHTTKTSTKTSEKTTRDEEAFRLSQQPGKVISVDVAMTDATTRMITEKKELTDGTIVTTKRYEKIGSDTPVDQPKFSSKTETTTTTSQQFKTARDEEAFRLSQQPGKVISTDVTMTDATTRMITEKKELNDGTIVTTKRFEKVDTHTPVDQSKISTSTKKETTTTTSTNQQFKTPRDEEAFRLSQQPGKVISRDVAMTDATTRMITEKKELTDGTIVTTKRYEKVGSDTPVDQPKFSQKPETTQQFKTPRDEEAFRLSQQPGKVISRDVSMTNPTTRMIVEKKELNDGTIVTTKRFESVNENVEKVTKHHVDLQSQSNVKKTTENVVDNQETVKKVSTTTTNQQPNVDNATQREVVEESVTKKIFDTSCHCPSMDKHDHKTREFIQSERTNDKYDVTSEIIRGREETRKLEPKRVEPEPQLKITRELEVDSAHRAFASSLRSVTPPPDKQRPVSRDHDRRSPSRETTSSKFSSSTMTIKKNSDVRRSGDFMRPTQASDMRTNSKSPEKQPKKTTKATSIEVIEYVIDDKPREVSPVKSSPRAVPASYPSKSATLPRESSPQKPSNTSSLPREKSPQKPASQPRESSPTKPTSTQKQRESSPIKSSPATPRSSSPQKPSTASTPRETSPMKSAPSVGQPREVSPVKSAPSVGQPREVSPVKSAPSISQPREVSPQKPATTREFSPIKSSPSSSPHKPSQTPTYSRESSPVKPRPSADYDASPHKPPNSPESSPIKEGPSTPRSSSPQKPSTTPAYPRESSPVKSKPSTGYPRDGSPYASSPVKSSPSPQKPSTPRESSPSKPSSHPREVPQQPTASATFPRAHKPTDSPRSQSPEKTATFPRDSSPFSTPREGSPVKSRGASTPRAVSPQKPARMPRDEEEDDDDEDFETNELLTATLKIDSIDKTINDLKIVQTIDSKNMSATTSVSDLEYISGSEHKKLVTDLDYEDIEVKINIENASQLDDLQVKTTVSEIVDEKPKKGKKKPLNRSETFEERAKKLIGVQSDDDVVKEKDIPSYLKPTKASSAPDKTAPHRVSEIRERKAKIEELEKTTTTITKKNSLTSATNEFILNEKTTTTNRSPVSKKPTESKKPDNRSSDIEDTRETKKTTNITITRPAKSPEKKKPDERPSRSSIKPETHITVAQITISPSRGITSKMVTKTTTVQSNKSLKVAPSIRLVKQTPTDVSSTDPDTDTDHELIKNIDKTGSKSTRKKLIQNRKDSAPVTKTTTTTTTSTATSEKEKVSRSVSEKIIKVDKRTSGTRDSPKKDTKRPAKCIATKTINLSNVNGHDSTLISNTLDNVEIDLNVQHAKSSREPSPNKVIPIPVHTDDEINEEHLLHPNKVTEPEDESRRSKPKVINVPIFQEQTKQFVGLEITEIGTENSQTILEEEESEDSERVINSSTLEKADRKRNSVQIEPLDEDDEEEHAHLLSVSQKVNKFNEAVDELKKPKPANKRHEDDDFKLEDVPDDGDDDHEERPRSVTQKVSKFSKVTDETTVKQQTDDLMTRSVDEVDENLKNDDCLLSVSDKVNKFIATSEKIASSAPQKSPELVKNIMKQTSKQVKEKIDHITDQFITNEKVSTTTSKTSDITLRSTEAIKKAREVFENNSSASRDIQRHSDIVSRPSVFEAKRTPTVERKVYKETITSRSSSHEKSPEREAKASSPRRGSNDRTPVYMKDQVSTKKDLFEKRISSSRLESENYHHKSLSPQNSIDSEKRHSITDETHAHHQQTRRLSSDKHYMQHTVASLEHVATTTIREAELQRTAKAEEMLEMRRDSLKSPTKMPSEPRDELPSPRTPTKFGVELKRTDSYKTPSQSSRKVSTGSETINIEEIFDLEELERLLEIVVGYEQRRKIRSQIRLVRKRLEERKVNSEIKSRMSAIRTAARTEATHGKSREPRVTTTTTTTTTTTRVASGDKEPKVTRTVKVTPVTTSKSSTSGKTKTESVVKSVRKTSATSNTSQQQKTSVRESKAETDCITSSYGVGPTDSNGLPLFGLKALKKKPTTVESKTTGTVISEVSYSENGGPAVVQRKTTKYSSDPSDFSHETDVRSPKAATERKNSRGGVYSVTKVEKYEKPTPKVIRNGSVKELKEKFVRKDSSSKMSSSKRSSVDHESESHSVSKSTASETKTFLNSERKASNVKEVITMMKNADNVYEEGDTQEDAEARALLNKFFGATALMTSIEKGSGLSKDFLSSGGAKNKNTSSASRVTTTKTVTSHSSSGSGKSQDINDIWDVDLLKKLLEATTNYDERRKVRERIRQVMADKEACAEIVQQVSAELDAEGSSAVKQTDEGESLLLPLLTGILQNPKYRNLSARQVLSLNLGRAIAQQSMPQNSASKMNSEHNPNLIDDNGGCLGNDFPIEDSGTESGEDLRLLAASLSTHMDESKLSLGGGEQLAHESAAVDNGVAQSHTKQQSLGSDLLSEVTTALERLQSSLNLGEIDLDDSKKAALLSLVNRLQSGLVSSERKIEAAAAAAAAPERSVNESPRLEKLSDERRGSGGNVNRFNKKKNRANRHTVGVTREELADARRIIEEIEFIGLQNAAAQNGIQPKVTAKVVNSTPGVYNAILTRQISEPITLLRPSQFVPKETQMELKGKPKYKLLFKQSISLDQPSPILKNPARPESASKSDTVTRNSSENSTTSNSITFKNDAQSDEDSSSSDDEDEMVNTKFYNGGTSTPNGNFKAKEAFLRNQEKQQAFEKSLNYSSGDEGNVSSGSRPNKYASKKMKMKRANTTDLPKSYSFVNTFELSERDCSDHETMQNTFQNRNSAGLKTTFSAGSAPMPPTFTPKTENDKKFLAFIEKQQTNITPTYVNPSAVRNEPKQPNWTNKFGNLKTKFEDVPKELPRAVPKTSNAAANFWKNIEKDKPISKVSPLPAVPIKTAQPFIKTLPTSTEKFPWKNNADKLPLKLEEPVVPKKKQFVEKFIPKEQPETVVHKTVIEPNKLPSIPTPANVNNFSHAPLSAFKPPISRKLSNSFKPIINEDVLKKPMPQITNGVVKQMAETGYSINNPVPAPRKVANSPSRLLASLDSSFMKVQKVAEPKSEPAPWATQPKSERVLSLAASKFENVPTVHLASHLSESDPIVKFRNNPVYNGTFEKRASLPVSATYAAFEANAYNDKKKEATPPKSSKEATFVFTDYTSPTQVSTYAPERPTLARQDSLTNPSKEPLVLTCDRTVISPRETFVRPIEMPVSPQISTDASLGSICDDLERELDDLGESIECQVAVSKVMRAPIAQTAYTQASELTSLNGQSKENSMMRSLQDTLKKVQHKSPTPPEKSAKRLSQESSNSSIDLKLQALKTPAAKSESSGESRLSQDSSNSSLDIKLPPLKIPIPAVPETAYSITYKSPPRIQVKSPSTDPPPALAHVLYNNVSPNNLVKGRSLAIPKPMAVVDRSISPPGMYGVPQTVIDAKQSKVASFFTPTAQRAESLRVKPAPLSMGSSHAHRKVSLQVKPMTRVPAVSHRPQSMNSLSRSKTMPSLANVELLDESNIDDAFEELLSSSNL